MHTHFYYNISYLFAVYTANAYEVNNSNIKFNNSLLRMYAFNS